MLFSPSLHTSLLVLLAGLLPTYLLRFTVFGIPTTFLEVAIWALFFVGLLTPAIRTTWRQAAKQAPKPLVALICLFLISVSLSTAISPHLETSLGILKGWIITPMIFAFMVYAAGAKPSLRTSRNEVKQSPRHAEIATLPPVARDDAPLGFESKILQALTLSGLVIALHSLSQLGIQERLRGVFDVPNSLALFLAPLVILAVTPLIRGERGVWSHFNGLAAVIMFLALLFTQSLAGVASVLIILIVIPLIGGAKGVWGTVAIGIVLAMSFLLLQPKITYLLQSTSSAAVRLQLWSISWDLIKERPLLGVGLGTFEPAYQKELHKRFGEAQLNYSLPVTRYPLPEYVFRDPHNWILSFWLNTGLLGLISFIGIHAYVFWKATYSQGSFLVTRSSFLAAIIVLLLVGLADTIYWKNDLSVLHWGLLALLIGSQSSLRLTHNYFLHKSRNTEH